MGLRGKRPLNLCTSGRALSTTSPPRRSLARGTHAGVCLRRVKRPLNHMYVQKSGFDASRRRERSLMGGTGEGRQKCPLTLMYVWRGTFHNLAPDIHSVSPSTKRVCGATKRRLIAHCGGPERANIAVGRALVGSFRYGGATSAAIAPTAADPRRSWHGFGATSPPRSRRADCAPFQTQHPAGESPWAGCPPKLSLCIGLDPVFRLLVRPLARLFMVRRGCYPRRCRRPAISYIGTPRPNRSPS